MTVTLVRPVIAVADGSGGHTRLRGHTTASEWGTVTVLVQGLWTPPPSVDHHQSREGGGASPPRVRAARVIEPPAKGDGLLANEKVACSLSRSSPPKTLPSAISFLPSQQGPGCTRILYGLMIKEHRFVNATSYGFIRKEVSMRGTRRVQFEALFPKGLQNTSQHRDRVLRREVLTMGSAGQT